MEKKYYRIYQISHTEFSIEIFSGKTHTISGLSIKQVDSLVDFLTFCGYVDKTDEDWVDFE